MIIHKRETLFNNWQKQWLKYKYIYTIKYTIIYEYNCTYALSVAQYSIINDLWFDIFRVTANSSMCTKIDRFIYIYIYLYIYIYIIIIIIVLVLIIIIIALDSVSLELLRARTAPRQLMSTLWRLVTYVDHYYCYIVLNAIRKICCLYCIYILDMRYSRK